LVCVSILAVGKENTMALSERSTLVLEGQPQTLPENAAILVDQEEEIVHAPLPEASDGSDGSGGTDTDEEDGGEEEDGSGDGPPVPPQPK
jgi:hypothetical protein